MGFCGGDNDEDEGETSTTSQPCGECGDDGPHKIRGGHYVCPSGHVNVADMRTLSDAAYEAEHGIDPPCPAGKCHPDDGCWCGVGR